jgi:aminopeptidase C
MACYAAFLFTTLPFRQPPSPPTFHSSNLSPPSLFFFDKLQRCNWLLENIIDTADEEVGSRVVQHLLLDPLGDGKWDPF